MKLNRLVVTCFDLLPNKICKINHNHKPCKNNLMMLKNPMMWFCPSPSPLDDDDVEDGEEQDGDTGSDGESDDGEESDEDVDGETGDISSDDTEEEKDSDSRQNQKRSLVILI